VIGKPVNRVEGADKVTGRATYTADVVVPGVTHAVLVQSEIPHGTVTGDSLQAGTDRALAAPGVLRVLTPLNCPPLQAPPHELSYDLPLERRPPLSDLTVQYVGQHMAMVIADTLENAVYAASSFELAYEAAPPQLTAREVLEQPVPPDDEDGRIRHGSYQPDHFVKLDEEKLQDSRGADLEPAGATRVSARYTTPVNAHYPIELSATIAHWDDDVLTVYDTTRWITGERTALAAYLGIPETKVHILSPLVGGAWRHHRRWSTSVAWDCATSARPNQAACSSIPESPTASSPTIR
jgi:xanthine dehydrogenase YagR molybdenum-binding subunit